MAMDSSTHLFDGSAMKSLMMLWSEIAKELGDQCSISTTRDYETVTSRSKDEGLSFLTITLPNFCKDFEKSLAEGLVANDMFLGFKKHAGLPRFLGGFLSLIFDRTSGVLLDDPDVVAIQAVRQLTLIYGKLEIPCSPRRTKAAIEGFVECEQEVKKLVTRLGPAELADFRRMSGLLWGEVLQRVDNDLFAEHAGPRISNPQWPYVVPKHGPGATADRRTGNRKNDFCEWTSRLEAIFPYGDYALPSYRFYDLIGRVNFLEPGAERPVRVITVPKTLKTPRIIAIEPSYMQYMQQGLKDMIVDSIHDDSVMGKVVGFDDQWRNNLLAQKGSIDGSFATLDLSEASDRVSNLLVEEMTSRWPHVREAISVTRSETADVPGHGVIPLAKFASMGSALTFPVEAMIFSIVVFLGIEKSTGHRLTRGGVNALREKVRVFGDDIIVPGEFAYAVTESLGLYGFKVNSAKSFLRGNFRESCGKEYYAGHDVSVVRVRQVVRKNNETVELPSSRRFVRQTESVVALRNRFYLSGLWRTAAWLDRWNTQLLGGYYPTIAVTASAPWEEPSPRSDVLGRWTVLPRDSFYNYESRRMHQRYQVPVTRGWVVKQKIPSSKVSGVGALLKVLRPKRFKPFEDPLHLERAGRPESVRMKLRWTTA